MACHSNKKSPSNSKESEGLHPASLPVEKSTAVVCYRRFSAIHDQAGLLAFRSSYWLRLPAKLFSCSGILQRSSLITEAGTAPGFHGIPYYAVKTAPDFLFSGKSTQMSSEKYCNFVLFDMIRENFVKLVMIMFDEPMENSYMTVTPPWKRFCKLSPSMVTVPCLQRLITVVLLDSGIIFPSKSLAVMAMLASSMECCTVHIRELDGSQKS